MDVSIGSDSADWSEPLTTGIIPVPLIVPESIVPDMLPGSILTERLLEPIVLSKVKLPPKASKAKAYIIIKT
jgi:hypothetical protein